MKPPENTARTVRLGELCDMYIGVHPALHALSPASDGIPIVRGADLVTVSSLSAQKLFRYVAQGQLPERARLRAGDVLVPNISERLHAVVVREHLLDCFASHNVTILRPRGTAVRPAALAGLLTSAAVSEQMQSIANSLRGGYRITISTLAELIIPLIEATTDTVESLVTRLSQDLIRLIAKQDTELLKVEWRDLERVLATAFDNLGFDVHLTPPAKDGGKDIILECHERGIQKSYVVEIKHWTNKAVGSQWLRKFLSVIVGEKHDSGLLLATSGFTQNAYQAITELEYKRLRIGEKSKIVSICQMSVRYGESNMWIPGSTLTELLYEGTEEFAKS